MISREELLATKAAIDAGHVTAVNADISWANLGESNDKG